MTVADSAQSAGNVAASLPNPGQVQSSSITALTPLPKGWGSFCSTPSAHDTPCWYATAPWHVDTLKMRLGKGANGLEQTVFAETWPALHKIVAVQTALYMRIMQAAEES